MFVAVEVYLDSVNVLTKNGFSQKTIPSGKKFLTVDSAKEYVTEKYGHKENVFYRNVAINFGKIKSKEEIEYINFLKEQKEKQDIINEHLSFKQSIIDSIEDSIEPLTQATDYIINLDDLTFTKEQIDYLYKNNCKD